MTKIFDEENGYLTNHASEIIESMRPLLINLAKDLVTALEDANIPELEWNLFVLYYKEQVYTELLYQVAQRRIQKRLSSKT